MRTAIRKHLSDFIAITVMFVVAIGVTAYIVSQQESRSYFPIIEKKPFELKAEFSDAQAVIPGQGQTVRVAGVEVGKISKVEPKNGVAVVTMDINRDKIDDHELDLRSDAVAQLRPRTGLKDMFVELDPGTRGVKLKDGATLPVQNTEPDVDPDEILSALDTDTRSYLQLLIAGLGKGLRGHGDDLNATFKALGPTQRDLSRVSKAVASRRHQLSRLVHNFADLTNTLANRDQDVRRLVTASNATLSAFAQENQNLSAAVAKLPSTLQTTSRTLSKVTTFSGVLKPSLQALRPAFRELDVANHAVLPFVRAAYPITKNHIRPFVQYARPYVQDLRPAAKNLAKATPDLQKSLFELNRFFNMAGYNKNGAEAPNNTTAGDRNRDEGYLFWVGWVAHNTVSLFSSSDARGPIRRFYLGLTCDTIRAQITGSPLAIAFGSLTQLDRLLDTTGICAGSAPRGSRAKAALENAAKGEPAAPAKPAAKPSATTKPDVFGGEH